MKFIIILEVERLASIFFQKMFWLCLFFPLCSSNKILMSNSFLKLLFGFLFKLHTFYRYIWRRIFIILGFFFKFVSISPFIRSSLRTLIKFLLISTNDLKILFIPSQSRTTFYCCGTWYLLKIISLFGVKYWNWYFWIILYSDTSLYFTN